MKKRIVICCDGTWNTPDDKKNGIPCPTNVAKIAESVSSIGADKIPQIVYYHDGVGTGNRIDRLFGGAFGIGLSENIKDAYRFLIYNYNKKEGDDLYFFGFSRGAYTVRSLVGLIRNCGLLRKERAYKLSDAYDLYRNRKENTHPNSSEAFEFRNKYSVEPDVWFMGVWDTVGSLGIPDHILSKFLRYKWRFHDVRLSSIVKHAYHAVSIDERRASFKPSLWEAPETTNSQQVWFSGVHADVGGGYDINSSVLSDIALKWMMEKAAGCGLSFDNFPNISSRYIMEKVHEMTKLWRLYSLMPGSEKIREIKLPAFIHKTAEDRKNLPCSRYNPPNLPGNRIIVS